MVRESVLAMSLILVVLSSCIREIPYGYTDSEEKLYVIGQLSNTDTTHLFYLGVSRGSELLAPSGHSRVDCSEEGILVATSDSVWYDENHTNIQLLRMPSVVRPGHKYRFDIYSGQLHASASVESEPLYNAGLVLDTVSKPSYSQYGAKYYERFAVCLQDGVGKRNYYRASKNLSGIITYWKSGETAPCYSVSSHSFGKLSDDNPVLFDEDKGPLSPEVVDFFGGMPDKQNRLLLFSDYQFQDGGFSISYNCSETSLVTKSWDYYSGSIGLYDYYTISAEVSIMTMPEIEYKYLYLSDLASLSGGDVLNSPIILPDNIDDGFGFIGIVTQTIMSVDLGLRTAPAVATITSASQQSATKSQALCK